MRGQPLTLYERQFIELRLRGRWGVRKIARGLYRDHSVISRELERNRGRDGIYRSSYAEEMANRRAHRPHRRKLDEDDVLRNEVCRKLREGWSPEKVAGRIKNRPDSRMSGRSISHEAIYQYIYEGNGRFMGLYQYLVRHHKKRQRQFARKSKKDRGILHLTPIRFRPDEINERQDIGHWESDSIVSRESKPALSVQRERMSHLVRITKVPDMTAFETYQAIQTHVEDLGPSVWKSITFDRGSEGADHWKLRMDYGIDTFHCDPYCSWQKGSVENSNGLIRRFFPKGTDFSLITDHDVYVIQEKLNNQPRKALGYKTPNEVWTEITGKVVH